MAHPLGAQPAREDTDGLGTAPFSRMHALLERTIFQVDVLTLTVCVDAASAGRLASIAGWDVPDRERADSVAAEVLGVRDALAITAFERSIGLDQFLDGIEDDQEKAVEAGFLADSTFQAIQDSLPVWYAFLDQRRIQDGDRIFYRFFPGGVRTQFVGVEGEVLLDRVSLGEERRRSVLGTFLAPRTSLRDGLVKSLVETRHSEAIGRCLLPA